MYCWDHIVEILKEHFVLFYERNNNLIDVPQFLIIVY